VKSLPGLESVAGAGLLSTVERYAFGCGEGGGGIVGQRDGFEEGFMDRGGRVIGRARQAFLGFSGGLCNVVRRDERTEGRGWEGSKAAGDT
jgi:hypothetical protein